MLAAHNFKNQLLRLTERDQKIAVANVDAHTISLYSALFRVLDLKSFENNFIKRQNSPIYKTTSFHFDILEERVENVKQLK